MKPEDKRFLVNYLEGVIEKKQGIRITKEHTAQGISYLKGLAFRKDGSPRQTKSMPFGTRELEVLRTFKYFRLVGLDDVFNGCGEVTHYRFIWLVQGRTDSFKYVQGGGPFDGIKVI